MKELETIFIIQLEDTCLLLSVQRVLIAIANYTGEVERALHITDVHHKLSHDKCIYKV